MRFNKLFCQTEKINNKLTQHFSQNRLECFFHTIKGGG